jgi:hypothetical protein
MFDKFLWKQVAFADVESGDYKIVVNNLKNHNISVRYVIDDNTAVISVPFWSVRTALIVNKFTNAILNIKELRKKLNEDDPYYISTKFTQLVGW